MVFNYDNNIKAHLKSTFIENTLAQAVFYCEKATIKINSRFHQPSNVTLIVNGKEKIVPFENKSIGYNYEIMHFNQLLKDGKTESDVMSFDFSKILIQTLDEVREIIGLNY